MIVSVATDGRPSLYCGNIIFSFLNIVVYFEIAEIAANIFCLRCAQLSTLEHVVGNLPEDFDMYYGFTRFAIELNELREEEIAYLPRTDTRFRPDQR